MVAYSALSASMSAGYGVLFTLVGDFRNLYGIPENRLGLIISSGFIAGFLAQIFIAPMGDRGAARSLIGFAGLVNVIGLLVMAFSGNGLVLFVGRVISGLADGTAQPVVRRLVVLEDPDNVGQNLGRLGSATIFGFAAGPAISAVLVEPLGLQAPFIVVAVMVLVSLSFTLFNFKEPQHPASPDFQNKQLALDLLNSRPLLAAICFGAATYVMIGSFDVLWDITHEDLGTNRWLANLGISVFALPLVILGPSGGRLAQRIGPFRVAPSGLIIASGFMYVYGLLKTGELIVAVSIIHAVIDGLTFSSTGVGVAQVVPKSRQAGAQGLLGGSQALSGGLAAAITGSIYERWGPATAFTLTSLIMVTLVVTGVWLAAKLIFKPQKSG